MKKTYKPPRIIVHLFQPECLIAQSNINSLGIDPDENHAVEKSSEVWSNRRNPSPWDN